MKMSWGLYWGVALVVGGAFALAQSLGYVRELSPQVAFVGFVCFSLLAFTGYWQSGWKNWGWLFPTGIFGGLAVTVLLTYVGINRAITGTPLFLGLLIPFIVAYMSDRARNWWALIPGSVMLVLAMVTAFVDSTNGGAWIGSLVLFVLALGFFAVYLNNPQHKWAMLVAYILAVVGIAPLMSMVGNLAAFYGSIVMLGIALPFFFVYLRAPQQRWWAIIPAGVLTTVAVIATVAIAGWIRSVNDSGFINAILMGGLAATFAVIWLRHAKSWAKIVAIVLALIAVASIFFASNAQILFPIAIILVGGYLLFTSLRTKPV